MLEAKGVREERLVRVDAAGLTAWATALADDVGSLKREDLLAHHRLVSEIFASADAVLPARFPTWVPDDATLIEQLRARREEFVARLEGVRGSCELAVTALWTAPLDEAPAGVEADTPGRRYLLSRRQALASSDQRRARADTLADELERAVGPDLVQAGRVVCPSAAVALSLALLVRRPRAADIKLRLVRAQQDVRILVNGPWPPYTFAAAGSD
jgi:Gas vesicle synthesis protein GvpL/GvpF